jgi:cobalt transporter subunit CbtB
MSRFLITFKYLSFIKKSMSQKQTTITTSSVSKVAIAALALVFGFGLFVVGFDQGHIFSVVMGEQAFDEMFIHELTHDMRHAAGFPCH